MPQKFIENMVELSTLNCQKHATTLRDALTRLFENPDDEAVHDVRVTCRRMRVALEIFGPLCRKRVVEGTRKRVRNLLRLFGESRDAEVLGERARKLSLQEERTDEHLASPLRTLASLFEAQSRLSRLQATSEADRHNFWTLPRLIEALFNVHALSEKGIQKHGSKPVREVAQTVIQEHFDSIAKYSHLNARSESEELHELRIEFKKLRYSAEFFIPVLARIKALLSACEGYQKILGDLHDADVAVETLSHFARRTTSRTNPAEPVAAAKESPLAAGDDDASLYLAGEALFNAAKADQIRLRKQFAKTWTPQRIAALKKQVAGLNKAHAKIKALPTVPKKSKVRRRI